MNINLLSPQPICALHVNRTHALVHASFGGHSYPHTYLQAKVLLKDLLGLLLIHKHHLLPAAVNRFWRVDNCQCSNPQESIGLRHTANRSTAFLSFCPEHHFPEHLAACLSKARLHGVCQPLHVTLHQLLETHSR